jgi:diacylglycerol kinase
MKHAVDGLIFTIKSERNFRIHLVILFLTVIIGLLFGITNIEWLFITVISSVVLFAELINTAIEKFLDWLEPNHHDIVKIVKDVCAGAVLVSSMGAVIVGLIIFIPYGIDLALIFLE